ncbi:hypothetical protein A2U01_0005239 [Trifolium medium]|uniref:Integrase catalytic domain-containing protein n=1 Tax=Trifolium medium TaxID=97028 RepID=A0A392MA66_9FABA|nr:hypothetical protein [Trifolium medium]
MDANKTKDVLAWPIPKDVKQLRGFLGLTGYYICFVKSYAKIASPLTELLKKDAFVWNPEAEASFHKLKQAITTTTVLRLPDFSEPFTLDTYASRTGVGAVLGQRGHKFVIKTDQKSLKSLMDQSLQTLEQHAWLHKFIGFDFQIEYKPGKDNIPVNALSRMYLLAWLEPKSQFLPELQLAVQQDPLPIPNQVWEDVAMDFITGLPKSFGFSVIMVVIDRLTKCSHLVAQKTDYTSKSVAESFMSQIVKLHGIPKSIVSDRDKVFTSSFWQNLFKLQGTSMAISIAYHPQTDGKSEALNKCLEMYLRFFTFQNPKGWYKLLPIAEYWHNTAFHTSAGMTPFKALYWREAPTLIIYGAQAANPHAVREQLMQRDAILDQLKGNLIRAQQIMKVNADKKRKEDNFKVGYIYGIGETPTL